MTDCAKCGGKDTDVEFFSAGREVAFERKSSQKKTSQLGKLTKNDFHRSCGNMDLYEVAEEYVLSHCKICGYYHVFEPLDKRRKVVCLCGSTKFKDAFEEANREESLMGNIVLTVAQFSHHDALDITDEQKDIFDALHFDKIKLADEVLVLDVNGYIGESTQKEIDYAKKINKPVKYLSTQKVFNEPVKRDFITMDEFVEYINNADFPDVEFPEPSQKDLTQLYN